MDTLSQAIVLLNKFCNLLLSRVLSIFLMYPPLLATLFFLAARIVESYIEDVLVLKYEINLQPVGCVEELSAHDLLEIHINRAKRVRARYTSYLICCSICLFCHNLLHHFVYLPI